MAGILLTTLNAKHIHAAFGLRYLLANLGSLRQDAAIAEFDVNQRPVEIAEAILAQRPTNRWPWRLHLERRACDRSGCHPQTRPPGAYGRARRAGGQLRD